MSSDPTTTTTTTNAAGNPLPPLPADHLSHPEQWATGGDPATSKQKGFINVLAAQHPDAVPKDGLDVDNLGKSEASEVIEKLKNGQKVESAGENDPAEKSEVQKKVGEKRKAEEVDEQEVEGKQVKNGSIETGDKGNDDNDATKENGTTPKKAKNIDNKDNGTKKNGSTAEKAIDVDADDDGDEKEEGQTTLDGAFKATSAKAEKTSTADTSTSDNDETADRPSESKKPRVDHPPSTSTDAQADNNVTASTDDTIPGDNEHLDHPENWTTGDEPATEKQKGYLKVLEKQTGENVNVQQMGKSEASEKIDELRSA